MMAAIDLQQLEFTYPGAPHPTLRQLDLHIADGEAHALLGASGSGKTTLLNLLSGLLMPTAGALQFDDTDVSGHRGRERAVAQVFQFPVLYDSLKVRDNLAFPLRNQGYRRDAIARRTAYIAGEVEIEALLDRTVTALSLFEKQLVAVAKALMREDVSVVLLDEPLTAVEPKTKWRLRQTLRRVQADTGVTMVYVTHDQTEALTFADRVSVLADGEILQSATPEQIYARPEHVYVGHFVGSPGMNFMPGPALGRAADEILGFRPEWAQLDGADAVAVSQPISGVPADGSPAVNADFLLSGNVQRVHRQGTHDGAVVGISNVITRHGSVHVRGPVNAEPGERVRLRLQRYLVYRDQRLVDEVVGS